MIDSIARSTCSTPRGITAPGHPLRLSQSCPPVRCSAQRLAASPPRVTRTAAPRRRARRCAQRLAASPPRVTHGLFALDPQAIVLNASRHHRPGSPRPRAPRPNAASCAQRLAASPPRVTESGPRPRSAASRAQRLAASPPRVTVQLGGDGARETVLNASRHHRPGSHTLTLSSAPSAGCSTPRGITAPGHFGGRCRALRPRGVLNASRHHRPESPSTLAALAKRRASAQRLAASPPRVTGA